jgi:cytosine/adenosine deaminase-related metal-dependent hydrolase
MILRARTVVTMDGPPIENGAVAVAGERITGVGSFPEVRAQSLGEVMDLGEQILLPGLINTHCHLDYTILRGKIPRQESFADWIRAINAEKAKLSAKHYVNSINEGFAETKRFGTTTIANLEAFPELISQINEPIRTWWFAELIDVRDPSRATEIASRAVSQLKAKQHWGLAPHAPFTASLDLYRQCEEIARRENVLLTTHLAESREEMQMSCDLAGPLSDFLAQINPDLFEYDGQTPVEHLLESICLDERWLVVHLNSILASDLELLAKQSSKCHVIHCPRSHDFFGHDRFEFERLHRLGFNICLGTDSLASNDDLSLFSEMQVFQRQHPDRSSREIMEMCTVNPASALAQGDQLGKIRPGFYADFITIPDRGGGHVFDEIVGFDQEVGSIMIAGSMLRA